MDMHFDGVIFQTHASELRRRLSRPHPPCLVIDTRPRPQWAAGHIAGALPLAPAELEAGLPEGGSTATEYFVVGADPLDSSVRRATEALRRHGARRCVELTGGMLEWRERGFETEAAA